MIKNHIKIVEDSGVEISGYCQLSGENFSPQLVEKKIKINFDYKEEPGELVRLKFDKKKPKPFGYARIDFECEKGCNIILPCDIPILKIIEEHRSSFMLAGATDIFFMINVFYINQCNLEQDHNALRKLANLGVDLGITCVQID